MWCYQKPGFEALIVAELRKQQQCSQFCDTLLKAGGVSVPAHSCILSAISPHISSALSSSPAPPSGQSRLLEFQALGACTLLHIIRLLYSGEMAGEGENEKQEAIYAAAKLGISGLVEVTKSRGRFGGGTEQYAEVGVQTEPQRTEEHEGRLVRWRREVRDGSTYMWKEAEVSGGGRDMWTQTEEQLVDSCPPVPAVVPYETIDMSVLQSLGHTDSHQLVTVIYPPEENQTLQYTAAPPGCLQESTTPGRTSVAIVTPQYAPLPAPLPHYSTQTAPCVADSQSCWADPNPEEWEGERLEQFEGNIVGFINHFLNPEKRESPRRGRAGRKPRGAQAAKSGQQRTRRPRGRPRGRGRGTFTQMVDVQEIGVSKLQKLFLHRWRVRTPRAGQGGGAVGRRLHQKTREELEPAKKKPRRRGNVFEEDQSQETPQGRGGANTQRERRKTTQQVAKASLPIGTDQICRNQPTPSNNLYDGPVLTSSSPSIRPMRSHAAPYVSPASSRLYSPQFAPPTPPPHEDQPEHIDRLLEEVFQDLDILPNNKAPLSTGSNTPGNSAIQNKHQAQISSCEMPVLQQQCEGELNDILENLLQSFEQHDESNHASSCIQISPEASQAIQRNYKTTKIHEETSHTPFLQRIVNRSQTPGVQRADTGLSDTQAVSSKKFKSVTPARRPKRRRSNTYLFSLEKKKVKKPASSRDSKATSGQDQQEKQLQQTPVVKLTRDNLLSVRAARQGNNCELSEEKSPSKGNSHFGSFRRHLVTKFYPIRSRFRDPHIQDFLPFLEEDSVQTTRPPNRRCGRPKKNGNLLSSSHVESTTTSEKIPETEKCEAVIEEDDVDVVGGMGPSPVPVNITWTDSSEEEIDVGI
ncbi:uncharacterized protein LOC103147468 isoform X1 [Poecilia formosa]|uniref:uncharacterized protein LOC103147468 isoform X1 n=1 Tax=Poecilia formosa TaxID=48698 RepID=UPI000443E75F|nr:PREDICTED: uncharacterized protein LOC103147468 isoform X1 [Poecilia formosa]XP_016533927.1 PREDICTED: uncharacterized protein LOC103147468 isoform X1 [Poecilia formosa]